MIEGVKRVPGGRAGARDDSFAGPRRYLSHRPRQFDQFVRAAEAYTDKLDAVGARYLDLKPFNPFDAQPGNTGFFDSYFQEMYEVLNLIRAMDLRPGARVLEVGSGPGWVTEILMGLGFAVDALEPSGEMIAVAQRRVASRAEHHRMARLPRVSYPYPGPVRYHRATLEECPLPDDTFDGVLMYAVLHHVVDEERGLAQCRRVLKPGGVLAVGEGAWTPGDRALEAKLDKEMATYGTLENPFTIAYLDHLLARHGFEQVVRYHGVNGLLPADMGGRAVREVAQAEAGGQNILTALKPAHDGPSTADPESLTRAAITVLDAAAGEGDEVNVRVRLLNRGVTAWRHRPAAAGYVTAALHQDVPGGPAFREGAPRGRLPRTILPEQDVVLDLTYRLPGCPGGGPWYVNLVNEGHFFFSTRGTTPALVHFR